MVFGGLKDATKKDGEFIGLLEIEIFDENDHSISEGPFEIKIKLTDEMKKYNTFKLMYVKDDFTLGEVVDLKIDGDYLVGTIPHLSLYALVANNTTNPNTIDNITMWVTIFSISILCLTFGIYSIKKKMNVK